MIHLQCPKALQPPHPSAKRLGKAISPPPCQRGIPLYPLRYGITDEPFDAKVFPTLSTAAYPALSNGKAYGLRVLRPRSYVYLLSREEGRMWTRHYQVSDNIRFAPIWWTEADYDGDVPGRKAVPDEAGAARFLLAPPDLQDDTLHVLVSDTLLSHAVLWDIENDTSSWQTLLATPVKPIGGKQQHAFPAALLAHVRELAPSAQRNYDWSESQPHTDSIPSILNAMTAATRPRTDVEPQAVVVRDLGGLLSELNVLVGSRLADLQTYSADAARKLRVSEMIDQLGALAGQAAGSQVARNDPIGSAMPSGATGPDVMAANERANRARLAAHRKRIAHARNTERVEFIKQHPQRLQDYTDKVVLAAADLWTLFNTNQKVYDVLVESHAPDAPGYLDLRCLVGHTLPGLIHCKAGHDFLLKQVEPSGPIGLLKKAVLGAPEVLGYTKRVAQTMLDHTELGTVIVAKAAVDAPLAALQKVLTTIPADGASHQLSVMLGALVAHGQLTSPGAYWTSVYRPIMEVLDGNLARAHEVPLREVGNWMRASLGLTGVNGFRPQTVDRAAQTLVTLYDTEDVQERLAQCQRLPERLRFWHNARLALGGVAAFATVYSAGEAFKALGQEDGMSLGNALNATGKVLGVGAAGATMTRFRFEKQRDLAKARGEMELAGALDGAAKRWELIAIGVAAVAAMAIGTKDWWHAAVEESGQVATISFVSGSVQFAAGGVGFLHLLGRLRPRTVISLAESSSLLLKGTAGVARLSAGTIGWILLGVEALYLGLRHVHQTAVDEARTDAWIRRSVWGIPGGMAPFASDEEELQEFHRLFQAPSIKNDFAVSKVLAPSVKARLAAALGLPDDVRMVSVFLPGWRSQTSQFSISQQQAPGLGELSGRAVRHDDPDQVNVIDGVGVVKIATNALFGTTTVNYRPNGFTDADYVMEASSSW
ncbi:toxin VasX [Achromobacter spanius]|uniref:toxin VasX n=1 Tax=Achromobacter spanius TaxID=217203 RepID=UPI00312C8BC0